MDMAYTVLGSSEGILFLTNDRINERVIIPPWPLYPAGNDVLIQLYDAHSKWLFWNKITKALIKLFQIMDQLTHPAANNTLLMGVSVQITYIIFVFYVYKYDHSK